MFVKSFFCNIPQAKHGMDLSFEISNVTVIHSDLAHLKTELADEVDDHIGIGGKDIRRGMQANLPI